MISRIIPRSDWTSLPKVGGILTGPLGLVVFHHSYRPSLPIHATVEQERQALRRIDRYHTVVNKWSGGGYSFCIFQSGRIYEMRGWLRRGAHTEDKNSVAHGICFIINGSSEMLSDPAILSAQWLVTEGIRLKAISSEYIVRPHDAYVDKICPGNRIKALLPLFEGLGGERPTLRYGMRHEAVKTLQRMLGVTPVSGYFGTITLKAVKNFQLEHRLRVDGVVGPKTWAKLDG